MSTQAKTLCACVFMVIMFPVVAIVEGLELPRILTYLAGIIVFIGVFILGNNYDERRRAKISQISTYDSSTRTLKIVTSDRNRLHGLLQVKESNTVQYKYNPATLEYVGVTVGGVTTGGFHVNEATVSVSSFQKTGKYSLMVYVDGTLCDISKISLPADLADSAKNTPVVKDFLQNNCLVLKHTGGDAEYTQSEREIIAAAERDGRRDIALNVAMRAIAASYLTKAECDAIKRWLCG